ncbi:MAG: sugar phosphate isomerase/epimerase [Tannerellaceae bacterium]|jgi:sugar phosphate isomerase/epimerase|nr:sugar phosphate isomerase/epimerase [Tannerellaceae bacterium]
MNRREFINKGMAAAAACCAATTLPALTAACNTPSRNRIGIQLYSINKILPDDIPGNLRKLADIGYARAEAYGFNGSTFLNKPLKEWANIMKDYGIQLSGTHCGTPLLPPDVNASEWDYWRKSVGEMNEAGGKLLVQSFLPSDKSLDDLKRIAEQFNKIGSLCKQAGLQFGYHNHHAEFKTVEGEIIIDVLLKNTDPELVFFQIDLGHAVNGGGDILAYMKNYPKRFLSWHASDFKKEQGYTELGKGDVPYAQLFAQAGELGLIDLTVEQETGGDVYIALKNNFDYLSQYPWTKL